MGKKSLALALVLVLLVSLFQVTAIAGNSGSIQTVIWDSGSNSYIQNANGQYTNINQVYFRASGFAAGSYTVEVLGNGSTIAARSAGSFTVLGTEPNDVIIHLIDLINADDAKTLMGGEQYRVKISGDSEQGNGKRDHFTLQADYNFNITKELVNADEPYGLGDIISYQFKVQNTGNMNLPGVVVTDTMWTSNQTANISVGQTWTSAVYTYTVQAADINFAVGGIGTKVNTATATYVNVAKNINLTKNASVTVDLENPPRYGLTLTKTASTAKATLGTVITYTVVVTNTSNVELPFVVTDTMSGGPNEIITLAAGASKTYTYDYTVAITDMPPTGDLGEKDLVNTVTAVNATNQLSKQATATVKLSNVANPSISVTKVANIESGYIGDEVTYTVVVTNDGNVPLTGVVLSDSFNSGTATMENVGDLAVGATSEWEYKKVLVGDSDNTNFVDAEGYYGQVKVTDSARESVELYEFGEIQIQKQVRNAFITSTQDAQTAPPSLSGYTFTLTGAGEPIVKTTTGSGVVLFGNLREGTYTLTETTIPGYTNNLPEGVMEFVVDENGVVWYGDEESLDGPYTVVNTETPIRKLGITKSANDKTPYVGTTITYTITITNTGNVPVEGIILTDNLKGILTASLAKTTLLPGESTAVSYTQDITSISQIVNIATTKYYNGDSEPYTATETVNPRNRPSDPIPNPIPTPTPATPTPTPTPTPSPELTTLPTPEPVPEGVRVPNAPTEEIILTNEIPQATPVLPKTGGIPMQLLMLAGVALTGTGFVFRKKKN